MPAIPQASARQIAAHRKEYWEHKRRDALDTQMSEAKRRGDPLAFYAARDALAILGEF